MTDIFCYKCGDYGLTNRGGFCFRGGYSICRNCWQKEKEDIEELQRKARLAAEVV